jgi:hypothetical protein
MGKFDLTPRVLASIVQSHKRYWDDQKNDMYRYKRVYECRFWSGERMDPSQITVQTADGYGFIESYISSLFTKNPGVVVKNGLKGTGDVKKAQALANDFLIKQRSPIEDASRLALIYPNSYMKIFPKQADNVYDRVDSVACPPWQVIVDRDATRWKESRYVGHVYYMPLLQAKERFGNKDFRGVTYQQYFDKFMENKEEQAPDTTTNDGSEMFRYVEICEFYDFQNDMLYFWTPNWSKGNKFLDSTVIPFRNNNNEPIVPIVPVFFNRLPDKPMVGYSAMARVYDQLFEINLIRTFQANAVRKCSRQYLIKRGALDEDQMAQVTSGIDGLFIEVDEDDISNVVRPIPHNPMPSEMEAYYRMVQDDKDQGSILAPFTRGEATRASATEIAALAAYTSTEIGRLARERDWVIEEIAKCYLAIIGLYIDEDNIRDLIQVDGDAMVITPDDLSEEFYVYAIDQASTPISETVRKREFIQSIPLLQSLGVPPDTLLKELVNSLGLPDYIVEETKQAIEAAQSQAAANIPMGEGAAVEIPPNAQETVGTAAQLQAPIGPANLSIPGARSV